MASTLTAIQTVTVGAGGASSISFTSIPQTYTDLVIKFSARTSRGTYAEDLMRVDFNGATTSQSSIILQSANTTPASFSLSTTQVVSATTSVTGANIFSNGELYFPNYTSANYKSISADGIAENNTSNAALEFNAGLWSSTAAITSIAITNVNSSTIQQYSTFTLYGVFNSATESKPDTPTIGIAGSTSSTSAVVAFVPAGTGGTAASYVATSTPGSLTGINTVSPITVSGLTSGTSYTFTVAAQNPGGISAESAASNSVTPATGNFVSLASYSVTAAGGDSSISFSNIPGGYQRLQLRITNMVGTAGANKMTFNGDTGNNYRWWENNGNGTTTSTTSSNALVGYIQPVYTGSTSHPSATIIEIPNYSDGNKVKSSIAHNGSNINTSNTNNSSIRAGLWNSTAPITSITFAQQSGNIGQYSIYELYGIVG